jgi:Na+-transporting NADH:ubiquinone oxidoreductase subunit C
MNKHGIIYTILFTFIVSFLFVLVLAFANEGTRAQVAFNQTVSRQRAILNALGIEYAGADDVVAKYQSVDEVQQGDVTLYRAEVDGETVYAKEFNGSGLWGTISGIIAVDESMNRTVGLEIISHNETPGLGGRIDEGWFKEQLRGERIVNGSITVAGSGDGDTDHDNGEIDAITGASRTSDSMQVIINAELTALSEALGGNS